VRDPGQVEPGPEVAYRARGGVGAVWDADRPADAFLVRLGAPQRDDEAFVAFLEVGHVESDELAAAQGAGEPDEEEGGVPGAACSGREGGEHPAEQGDGDGDGLVLGGAMDPADPGPYRFDRGVVGWGQLSGGPVSE